MPLLPCHSRRRHARHSRPAALAAALLLSAPLIALSATPPPSQAAIPAAVTRPPAPSTLRMADRLRQIAARGNPMNNGFQSVEQAQILQQRLGAAPELANNPEFRFRLATALLNSGSNTEALAQFNELERLTAGQDGAEARANTITLRLNQALCHLREAERLNCLTNHNADSCLLPIQGGGIHRFQGPSHQAMTILTRLLEAHPDTLSARWLLNVAAMTVGDYPGRVPERWLIPPRVFASDIPFPRFRDAAGGAGIGVNGLSGGSVVDDFDGDNLLDIMVTSIGLADPMHFYHNNGDGTFADRTVEAGLGKATRLVAVEILWPGSGTRQRLDSLQMDRFYVCTEGTAAAREVPLKSFSLPAQETAHHHH